MDELMNETKPDGAASAVERPVGCRCENECAFGPTEDVRDVDFGIKFGEIKVCAVCGWRLYDDWTAMRAGSVERWLPPNAED